MFSDSELLGLPWRVVISERGLAQGQIELIERRNKAKTYYNILMQKQPLNL